ncbi:K+-transporting ATPase ATPase C chain [Endobacter medicaginis]|uniref:Potassium-transporting ATPase KdpC subunit n=3 Tax=Endobacter medicaginis TaxID=1181271 RepID=A0A839V3D6_9PROT|nr:potassium-transporting ATPase subunit KdpC [Endobacter medicaginis]MBB3174001.1 K+-transporting ATPase ATPase C chain [Endobacter medicaginis]MCX5475141.1 potassium-transporting ATPase subunit KdpC [Endobacter medicaginis]
MTVLAQIRPALTLVGVSTLALGFVLPLGFVGAAGLIAPSQAQGSLIERDGHVIGSALIGQTFARPDYFHPRPSATSPAPYNADNSSASNLGPTSKALIDRVRTDIAGRHEVPADALTTSGSGLDPDISPANARDQVARVAAARHLPAEQVATLVARSVRGPFLGIFGEPRVNVLRLNLALDAMKG